MRLVDKLAYHSPSEINAILYYKNKEPGDYSAWLMSLANFNQLNTYFADSYLYVCIFSLCLTTRRSSLSTKLSIAEYKSCA